MLRYNVKFPPKEGPSATLFAQEGRKPNTCKTAVTEASDATSQMPTYL